MNDDIVQFILSYKYYFKANGVKKSKWREKIAQKFRESKEYKEKKWVIKEFIKVWEELKKRKSI